MTRERSKNRATGEMRDIIINGGIALFSLGATALFGYAAVEAPTLSSELAAGAVAGLFGIGTAYGTERMIANIAVRRRLPKQK